ncbi:MAG TPA: hypothetical protein VN836_07150 [Verrucomicrobiae bacterium]|nr:hypothetical protein [Verrucomicrobiae bacterium]
MTLKRWVLWLCIVALVVSELLLFSANQQKSAAQADARDAKQQVEQLRAELEQSKTSNVEGQTVEIARLRSEHQDLLRLRNQVRELTEACQQLTQTNQQLAQQLKAAHLVTQEQQDALQAWQADAVAAQQAQRAAAAAAQQQAQTEAAQRNTCINNLRQIDAAKQQWALENNKTDVSVPTTLDLLPYLKGGTFPVCPGGGTYTINAVGLPPTCSIPGHVLPPP